MPIEDATARHEQDPNRTLIHELTQHIARNRAIMLRRLLTLALVLSSMSAASAQTVSAFAQLCNATMNAVTTIEERCKANARPFKREFLPGGRGPRVPEEFLAWLDHSPTGSHFSVGCVLNGKREVLYLGLYYTVRPQNFASAATGTLAFVDFQGNIGLRDVWGTPFVALAIQRITPPGRQPSTWDTNCVRPDHDAHLNQTIYRRGDWYRIYRNEGDDPASITRCLDREIRYDPKQCVTTRYKHVIGNSAAPIVDANVQPLLVAEDGGFYVPAEFLHRVCNHGARPSLESMTIVSEVCGRAR